MGLLMHREGQNMCSSIHGGQNQSRVEQQKCGTGYKFLGYEGVLQFEVDRFGMEKC